MGSAPREQRSTVQLSTRGVGMKAELGVVPTGQRKVARPLRFEGSSGVCRWRRIICCHLWEGWYTRGAVQSA